LLQKVNLLGLYINLSAIVGRPAKEKPLKASVVINTYNRGDYIENSIRSLAAQTYRDIEIVVVNGPSSDNTLEVIEHLRSEGLRMKYADCSSRNLSESRNIGIREAAGDVVMFIDDDASAHPRWVERLMNEYRDPRVGASGGFTVDHTGISFQCRYTVCDRMGNARFFDTLDPTHVLAGWRNHKYPSLLGTNCSFRRSSLVEIGGFDEVFAYMLDETDVCLRIFDLGQRIVTVPSALVFHKYAPSHSRSPERIPRSLLAPARSKVYFMLKHNADLSERRNAVFAEVDRYRKDIEFSNRWYLDHSKVTVEHYNRLMTELHQGIQEGLKLGFDSEIRKRRAPGINNVPPAFLPASADSGQVSDSERMRIYFVSQGLPPSDTSGIARWTFESARGLARLGHEVHVITRSQSDANHVDYRDGLWVHSVMDAFPDDVGFVPAVPVPDSVLRRANAVLAEIKRSQSIWGVDVVSAPIWDVEGLMCAQHLDVPVVTSLHTTYKLALPFKEDWLVNRRYRERHVNLVIAAERWLLSNSAAILANSDQIVADINNAYRVSLMDGPSLCQVVPHGVEKVRIEPTQASFVSSLPPEEAIRLLFVGRIEPRKGQDWFLKAMLELPIGCAPFQIEFVGTEVEPAGTYAKSVRALAARVVARHTGSSVNFLGFVEDARLHSLYRQCDALIATSRFESFGLILIEAMRFAKPVIGSQVGGMSGLIDNGVEGYLIDVEDTASLAARVNQLLSSPELRRQLGDNALKRFHRDYTTEVMAQRLAGFYRTIIQTGATDERKLAFAL
jgi:glycogen(starch) synthase